MNEAMLKERTKRLFEINDIVKKLDETIRPAAFLLLQDYVLGGVVSEKEKKSGSIVQKNEESDCEAFFSKFNHDKPADNAMLVAAYLYSQYGTAPCTFDEIKALANDVGVTIPERVDVTILGATRDGKRLFNRAGKGVFRPTVHGEAFLKKTYEVSKGKQQKPQSAE